MRGFVTNEKIKRWNKFYLHHRIEKLGLSGRHDEAAELWEFVKEKNQ